MPGTILTVIVGVNTAFGVYKTISTLAPGESTDRVADDLVRLTERAGRLNDHSQ